MGAQGILQRFRHAQDDVERGFQIVGNHEKHAILALVATGKRVIPRGLRTGGNTAGGDARLIGSRL
ncbi:hypothetical protein MoryE10_19730 [Methylogaea oryzae]|uniref:Uncharacterized protein n=1 Tax=Methylogaea oryzae TaxID=1295382 RepID=A0A8D4VRP8_9GAMM|nr:hypothetical protein MoryE10_19730 [Methylogaea oryzae]